MPTTTNQKRKADQDIDQIQEIQTQDKPRRRATVKKTTSKDFDDFTTLNLCFLHAVASQLKINPNINLTSLFKQYESHAGHRPFSIFEKRKDDGDVKSVEFLFNDIFKKQKE